MLSGPTDVSEVIDLFFFESGRALTSLSPPLYQSICTPPLFFDCPEAGIPKMPKNEF